MICASCGDNCRRDLMVGGRCPTCHQDYLERNAERVEAGVVEAPR